MTSLLVIGGARSGKSRYAQRRAEESGLAPIFIATAQAFDEEMEARIACHRSDRGTAWQTVEAPLDLPQAIAAHAAPDRVLLVDCLTLWVTNLLLGEHDIAAAADRLLDAIKAARGPTIFVSNEVGWGIVPENALARRFRDEAGIVNQRVAQAVQEVQLVVAGLAVTMK
ncbi:MAG: bifunctional adenosylcobinamide kinase/adenosylcobinamide-phosphate guanylyltransferase [Novosphingobium sp.]|uniref:bifunctional adenosylcobinamide kinase/adenosylcobinamide-phosphate guanylyltransferase n=1 Tax=Tsuneonella sp. CC-YZS046 TaxID=3042152 RepID=UPI002D79DAF7|nr:bifunctional adenosylcobinamide kinase/adenosylcobinamide-phosphate guanylyltransferase [Tsuneonella sp. CC-YZS046]WRO66258.1 bifunctional adenosylcobinamide kinase/adenosylcobinamide-phosphate guanylyltransferase [Tsuneonella sp. CC-YZS046]